jgi:hypothetical protein
MTMKSVVRLLVAGVTALCLAQPVLAEEQGAGVAKQAGDAWSTIRGFSVDKKNEAVAYGKKLMKESDAELARLEADAAKASGQAKVELDKQIDNLKVARAESAAKLARMEHATGGAWNDAKQGFADAYRDLRNAFGKVVGHAK